MLRKMRLQLLAFVTAALVTVSYTACAAAFEDGGFETSTTDISVKVGNPIYTTSSAPLRGDISAGQVIDMMLPVTVSPDTSEVFTAITILCDENNTLCDITYTTEVLDDSDSEIKTELTSSAVHESGKYVLKTYLWDGIDLKYIYSGGFVYADKASPKNLNTAWNVENAASLTSEQALDGLSSLKIKSADKVSDTKVTRNASVKAKKVYKLDFAAMGDANFTYDVTDAESGKSLIGSPMYFDGSDDWSFPSKAVFTTASDTDVTVVFADCGSNSVSYIDNVKITEELISNGGFEYRTAGYVLDGTWELTEDSYSGEAALKTDDASVKQEISLVGGRVYTLSVRASGDEYYLKVLNAAGDVIAFKKVSSSGSYTDASMDFKTEAGGDYTVEIRGKGVNCIDDISLVSASNDLVTNGSFENGTNLWRVRGGSGDLRITEGIDGGKALMLSDRSRYYIGAAHNVAEKINNYGLGKYKVSGYAKYADSDLKNGSLTVGFIGQYADNDKGASTKSYTQKVSGLSSEWTYFEVIFDITTFGTDENGSELKWCPTSKTSEGLLYFETGSDDTNSFCIADIKMEALSERAKFPEYGEYDGPGEPSEPSAEPDPKPEKTAVEVISNGSFDDGNTDGWLIRGDSAKTASLTLVDGADGTQYGLKLSGRSLYYTGVYQSLKEALNTYGKGEYVLSGYVKFTDATDTANIKAVIQTTAKSGSTAAKTYVNTISEVSNEWKYFEFKINIDKFSSADPDIDTITGSASSCVLYFETTSGNLRDIAIDGISLKTYIDKK